MMGAGAGLFSALAVMLGVAVLARALARRFGLLRPASAGRLRMEVVQRLALSPKQGLAVVRIGERLVTVSMGEGGVRPVLELGEAEHLALAASAQAASAASAEPAAAPAARPRLSADALVPVLAGAITRGVARFRRPVPSSEVRNGGATGVDFASLLPAFAPVEPIAASVAVDADAPGEGVESIQATESTETAVAVKVVKIESTDHVAADAVETLAPIHAADSIEVGEMVESIHGMDAVEPVEWVDAIESAEVVKVVEAVSADPPVVAPFAADQPALVTVDAIALAEQAAIASLAPAAKPAARRRASSKSAATKSATKAAKDAEAADIAAKPARRRGKAAERIAAAAEASLRAAAGLLLALAAGAIASTEAAAQDVTVPGLEQMLGSARQDIAGIMRTQEALEAGLPAADAAQEPATVGQAAPTPPRRPIQGTVQAKADSAFSAAGGPRLDVSLGQGDGGLKLSGTVGVVVMMGLLSLIPAMVLMMTGFTRILIVLHFVRQALGTQTAPPAHLIGAMALLLTGFVMAPTLNEANRTALQPWLDGQINEAQMLHAGQQPFRQFMLRQTRESDVALFVELSRTPAPASVDQVPLTVLASAFVTSELRTAFQMGFVLFLPFIVIDLVVASVLMSMGMMMLPPAMIALPFKLLLFVLVDGWALVVQGLVNSFR